MEDSGVEWVAAASGIVGAGIAAAVALVRRWVDQAKFKAEIRHINANARKLEVEAEDVLSERLISELNRISSVSEQQFDLIQQQRAEIEVLRTKINYYAELVQSLTAENARIKHRIN
jgi:hypothetical protein